MLYISISFNELLYSPVWIPSSRSIFVIVLLFRFFTFFHFVGAIINKFNDDGWWVRNVYAILSYSHIEKTYWILNNLIPSIFCFFGMLLLLLLFCALGIFLCFFFYLIFVRKWFVCRLPTKYFPIFIFINWK